MKSTLTSRYRVTAAETIEHALSQIPIFADLDECFLRLLAKAALRTQFGGGQLIFRQGEAANRFYIITQGKVGLIGEEGGEPYRFAAIGKNEVVGWSWLFPPHTWQFSARAIVPTDAIFFCGAQLREACESNKEFGYELMKRFSSVLMSRLQSSRNELIHSRREVARLMSIDLAKAA
ncbi:MAG: cyclic nucleotide-binding domain-containing protein [Verrucomicrobiales bacterium]